MSTFKSFIESGDYIKLVDIGDSVEVTVAVDPFTLKPRAGTFIDQVTKQPKMVFDYSFKDSSGKIKTFSNGSQSFARSMAKLAVGDKAKIVKVEKNGKAAYAIRPLKDTGEDVESPEEEIEIPIINQ
ncbi:MAG: hypothetical protein GY861_18175 [bacterium]|nr:hypothetical protein [bacterium]